MMYESRHNNQQPQRWMKKKSLEKSEGSEKKMDQILDLSGLSLDSLPNPTLNLAAISHLDLSNNNLQMIPESLTARLLNLVAFDVHSNQLKSLPNSIGCLSKLKILNLSGNLIASLPSTIDNCKSLEELNANFNQLTRLPDTIGFELTNLKKLTVNSNKLAFLPHTLSHLTALRVLDTHLNCLRSLPDDLENLINLQVLNVSQNFQFLQALPYSIGLLISLVELDVSYNKITALPDSIGCLRNLKKLTVEGNPLASPPPEVIEQGLDAVRVYLSDQMNGVHRRSQKKRSWVGKLVKYGTFNSRGNGVSREEKEGFIMPEYRSIDGMASPRYMGMFSPRRLFSPRHSFSK
ncbi:plant intracellular Ras-group-related LRR protein 6 [Momordica charantia]|uniref:Plant intracellular Ras-group-related LRR protein 6 n=1 Tax=Momordica charantia TaxID=3673 RepID=A0A6J1C2L1_MOMCH|nr:plant intracellular Ras-group-related LRR protein 6 [Momordica charantia]